MRICDDKVVLKTLEPRAIAALRALEACGCEAWFVGGCVRDALMGRAAHDIDMATSAHWRRVKSAFEAAGHPVYETGTAHGTVTVDFDGLMVEVTTYRAEGRYSDGRRPDSVRFLPNVEGDLARRDFTMNAIAFHPDRGLCDPFSGAADIERGIIRAVGCAQERMAEDALRVLRGVRFAAQLGFSLEDKTAAAMRAAAPLLDVVARERVQSELGRLLCAPFAARALVESGQVIASVIDELAPAIEDARDCRHDGGYCDGGRFGRLARTVAEVPPEESLRYAALLHDVAKAAGHAAGDDAAESARMTGAILRRLRVSSRIARRAAELVRMHAQRPAPNAAAIQALCALYSADAAFPRDLLLLQRACAMAGGASQAALEAAQQRLAILDALEAGSVPLRLRDLAIKGADVIEGGVACGPLVRMTLDRLLADVADGIVANERESLIAAVPNALRRCEPHLFQKRWEKWLT